MSVDGKRDPAINKYHKANQFYLNPSNLGLIIVFHRLPIRHDQFILPLPSQNSPVSWKCFDKAVAKEMVFHYKLWYFDHVFHIRACPAKRKKSIEKPKTRIAVATCFLLHKSRQTSTPDFSTVSNSQNDFGIRRSVIKLFPVNIARNVLICLKKPRESEFHKILEKYLESHSCGTRRWLYE